MAGHVVHSIHTSSGGPLLVLHLFVFSQQDFLLSLKLIQLIDELIFDVDQMILIEIPLGSLFFELKYKRVSLVLDILVSGLQFSYLLFHTISLLIKLLLILSDLDISLSL